MNKSHGSILTCAAISAALIILVACAPPPAGSASSSDPTTLGCGDWLRAVRNGSAASELAALQSLAADPNGPAPPIDAKVYAESFPLMMSLAQGANAHGQIDLSTVAMTASVVGGGLSSACNGYLSH